MANYTTSAVQTVPYQLSPVGQELIVIASCDLCVAAELNVKFCCRLLIDGDVIGLFKTTPNNKGVGIFDLSKIFSNYVSADNLTIGIKTEFKTNGNNRRVFPIHLIDKFSRNANCLTTMTAQIYTEFTASDGNIQATSFALGADFFGFNGYVKNTDVLYGLNESFNPTVQGFGYDTTDFLLKSGTLRKFLSNSPQIQWCSSLDYGTMALIPKSSDSSGFFNDLSYINIKLYQGYDGTGTYLGEDELARSYENGAYDGTTSATNSIADANSERLLYFGSAPANIRAWSSTFNTNLLLNLKSYTIQAFDSSDAAMSEMKIVNILCPNLKGYNPIRLAWLNQWGTWDYFTFNQKSIKSISTKGSTYKQLGGTWNAQSYNPYGYKGGNKTFRVNATEKISMNTDFITEEHSEWFEELINSPEIYILKDWESPRIVGALPAINVPFELLTQYSTPCTLKTTSFTKKTIANDKLVQYTIEVEKSKTLRTQAI